MLCEKQWQQIKGGAEVDDHGASDVNENDSRLGTCPHSPCHKRPLSVNYICTSSMYNMCAWIHIFRCQQHFGSTI